MDSDAKIRLGDDKSRAALEMRKNAALNQSWVLRRRLSPTQTQADDCGSFIGKLAGFASWLAPRSHALALFGADIGVDPMTIEDLRQALLSCHENFPALSNVNHPVTSVRQLLATILPTSRRDLCAPVEQACSRDRA